MGGREARRCPSVSWGLGPGLSVSSSLGPRRGCRLGACRAESRVTCPWAASPSAHPGPEEPPPCLSQCHLVACAASPEALGPPCPFSLRTCTAPCDPPLPVAAYSGSDLVGAAHLAQAHLAGALFCRPLRLSAWAPSLVGGACLA